MTERSPDPCRVRDGKFLEPCWCLQESCHGPMSKAGGLHIRRLSNFRQAPPKPSRTYAVLRGPEKKDIILNHCPFCGEQINQMWLEDAEKQEAAEAV